MPSRAALVTIICLCSFVFILCMAAVYVYIATRGRLHKIIAEQESRRIKNNLQTGEASSNEPVNDEVEEQV